MKYQSAVFVARSIELPLNYWTFATAVTSAILYLTRKRAVGLLRHIGHRISEIATRHVVTRFDGEVAYRILARRYCRSVLADETASSIRVPPSRRVLPVASIYVNLQLRVIGDGKVLEEHHPRPRAIRIVGEPGSGKSTFLRFQLVKGCDLLLRPYGQRRSRLPVFIELARSKAFEADDPQACCDALAAELTSAVDRRSHTFEKGILDHFLDGRGALILLDGLDEVRQDRLKVASEAVALLMAHLRGRGPNNRVYVTMREQCFRLTDETLAEEFAVVGRFDAFTGNDIFDYLCKWPWSMETALAAGQPHEPLSRYQRSMPIHTVRIAHSVFQLLETQPTLRRLCGNPLILAMYIATVEDDNSPVAASTKTEFFKLVSDELLYDRRARSREGEDDRRLALRSMRESIGMAAAEHLEATDEDYNTIPISRFHACLSNFYPDPELALLEFERYTGLIRFQGDDHITFIHGTFLDYFAARWYSNNNREPWLRPARLERRLERRELASGRLDGAIAHACSLAPRAGQDRALNYIHEFLPGFLGLAFLETRRYDHQRLDDYLRQEASFLAGTTRALLPDVKERLSIFVYVLFDLLLNGRYFPTVHLKPPDVVRGVVESFEVETVELFRILLRTDSSLALALAVLLEEDLSAVLPELYVESCHDWYVASALIGKLRSQDAENYSIPTCVLLAEASLRFPSVSFLLDTIHAPRETEYGWHLIRRHRKQTYEASGFNRSLLTVVLQRAVSAQEDEFVAFVQGADLTSLRLVRGAPKPNDWWLGAGSALLLRVLAVFIPIATGSAFMLSPTLNLIDPRGVDSSGVAVLSVAVGIAAVLGVLSLLISVRIKLFRLIHRPYLDLDYLYPFGLRSWRARATYVVTRVRYGELVNVIAQLEREPFSVLLKR